MVSCKKEKKRKKERKKKEKCKPWPPSSCVINSHQFKCFTFLKKCTHTFLIQSKKPCAAIASISADGELNMCMFAHVFLDFTRFSDIKRSNEWVRGTFLFTQPQNGIQIKSRNILMKVLVFNICREREPQKEGVALKKRPAAVAGVYRLFDPSARNPWKRLKIRLPPSEFRCSGSPAGNITVKSAAGQPCLSSAARRNTARTTRGTRHVSRPQFTESCVV